MSWHIGWFSGNFGTKTGIRFFCFRDELDYEKEMKNSFISLLLAIQNKRRVYANDRKRKVGKASDASQLPQYLTATIPYNDHQHIDNASIASLIKSEKMKRDINKYLIDKEYQLCVD